MKDVLRMATVYGATVFAIGGIAFGRFDVAAWANSVIIIVILAGLSERAK